MCVCIELRDFEPDDQQEIEVDEGNTAVIECHLPESQPQAQVRYSVKQEWLETSKGKDFKISATFHQFSLIPTSLSLVLSREPDFAGMPAVLSALCHHVHAR